MDFLSGCTGREEEREGEGEREKQILYINACMWNLEKWYRWTYLQGRNRDADVENGQVDMGEGRRGWDELGD